MKEREGKERATKAGLSAAKYSLSELGAGRYPFPLNYFTKGKRPSTRLTKAAGGLSDLLRGFSK